MTVRPRTDTPLAPRSEEPSIAIHDKVLTTRYRPGRPTQQERRLKDCIPDRMGCLNGWVLKACQPGTTAGIRKRARLFHGGGEKMINQKRSKDRSMGNCQNFAQLGPLILS